MSKWRIRENSIADYARFALIGLLLFPGLAALAMF